MVRQQGACVLPHLLNLLIVQWVTIPGWFKANNYTVLGAGKIFHPNSPPNNDEPLSWSQDRPYVVEEPDACNPTNLMFCVDPTSNQSAFNDFVMANGTIENLRYVTNKGGPWAVFMGLHYPHLTHHVPLWAVEKYMPNAGLSPNASGVIEPPQDAYAPENWVPIASSQEIDGMMYALLNISGKLVNRTIPSPINDTFEDWFWSTLRLGYRSAVTLTDYHIGLVLNELEALGVANDTLVVILGDHGWQTGEHRQYAKHTLWDIGSRTTLMFRAPWLPGSKGVMANHTLFELVDLYKTLSTLTGIPQPPAEWQLDGNDLSGLLLDFNATLKTAAFTQYDRCPQPGEPVYYQPNCEYVNETDIPVMGYSVRTQDPALGSWRLTEWYNWNGTSMKANFTTPPQWGVELYDHNGDDGTNFEAWENVNLAGQPQYASVQAALHELLMAHYNSPEDDDGPRPW
jgi:iduronate 2-sulfatase